jgi:hypothetical protein
VRTVLYVVLALVAIGATRHHPAPVPAAPTSGIGGTVLVVLLGFVGVGLVSRGARSANRPARLSAPHTHGGMTRRDVVKHENAHRRALRRAGGGGSRIRVRKGRHGWEGVTTPHSPERFYKLPPERQIAVYTAGGHGAPGTSTVHDQAGVKQVLASVPARDRRRVLRKGEALGRRWAR